MTRNIYALLVGISRFAHPKIHPLAGCADDVRKMGDYLRTLESDSTKVHIEKLMDIDATRDVLIEKFRTHGKKAGPDDIFLFYFSSHGVQEHADKVWWTSAPDKKLEALITYDAFHHGVYPIADKELRYLLKEVYDHQNCEIVTLFDCCHSGDNTRAVELDNEQNVKMLENVESKSLFTAPARNWSKFIFSDKFEKSDFDGEGKVNQMLPQANHTSISACSAYEPAYIVNGKSLFTNAFLDVMKDARGDVSYYNLHSRIMNNLRGKQTPRLHTWPMAGKQAFRSFLFGATMDRPVFGNVVYQRELGKWSIDLGAIHGVQPTSVTGQKVVVNLSDEETCEADIIEVLPGYSTLEMEAYANYSKADLGGYTGSVASLMSQPVFLSFHGEEAGKKAGKDYFQTNKESLLAFNIFDIEKPDCIPLEIHAISGRFYLSRPGQSVSLGSSFAGYTADSIKKIVDNIKKVSAWQFTRDLQNEAPKLFNTDVVEVEITQDGNQIQKVDGVYTLTYNKTPRAGKVRSGNCRIKFRNTGLHKIEFSCLYLGEDYSILLNLMEQKLTPLERNDEVSALSGTPIPFSLEQEEVDNKKKETVILLKAIYANSHYSIDMFSQEGLRSGEQMTKGGFDLGGGDEEEEVPEDWRTQLIKIVIPNPEI